MNAEYEAQAVVAETETDTPTPPVDAEARLQWNREKIRERLIEADEKHGPREGIERMVRNHPYVGLAGAALAGVWLVRYKPWRALGGSLLVGLVARQALALSLASGSRLIDKLSTDAAAKRGTARQP